MKKHSSSSFYFLGLQLAIVVLYLHVELSDSALVSSRPPLGNSIDDQNFCQLDLYRIQHFQGDPDKIRRNKRHRRVRRGRDKSVRTIGHCCWRLFKRPGYRGRSLILSGNANLHTTHRRGFFSRVRSVRKIQNCT